MFFSSVLICLFWFGVLQRSSFFLLCSLKGTCCTCLDWPGPFAVFVVPKDAATSNDQQLCEHRSAWLGGCPEGIRKLLRKLVGNTGKRVVEQSEVFRRYRYKIHNWNFFLFLCWFFFLNCKCMWRYVRNQYSFSMKSRVTVEKWKIMKDLKPLGN